MSRRCKGAVVVIPLLIPGLIFVGSALLLIMGFAVQYRLSGKVRADHRVAIAMSVVGIGAFLSVALLSRSLDDASASAQVIYYADYASGFEASRYLTLLLLFWSAIEVMRGCVRARLDPAHDPAMPLLYAMLAYYFGTLAIQATASDHPAFSYKALYVPMLLAAVFFQRTGKLTLQVTVVKWLILTLNLSSLLAALVAPDLVVHRPEAGVIPGINWRLFGFTTHANTIGPIALLALLLEFYWPERRRALRWTNLLAALAVLLLSQSKTSWFAVPVILLAVHAPLALFRGPRDRYPNDDFPRTVWTLLGYIAVLSALATVLVASDTIDIIERKADLSTLNGRTQIWGITLDAWKQNILFGYGDGIWDLDRRTTLHMLYVGHAHNQVVQTLGEAGLAGLALLLGYWGVLAWAALRAFVASRGALLALLLLMLVRSISEAPMRAEGVLSWPNLLHVLLLSLSCHYLRRGVQHASTATPEPLTRWRRGQRQPAQLPGTMA